MIETPKATSRPWFVAEQSADECLIFGGGSVNSFVRVYSAPYEQGRARHNAALIVRAVNAYEAMREALGAADGFINGRRGVLSHSEVARKIAAALAAAEEGNDRKGKA